MRRKNFQVVDKATGKAYWISRSNAVCIIPIVVNENDPDDVKVLISQRGKGTPDPNYVGCWNFICGYLDWGETFKEAASRELYEEVGLKVDPKEFNLWAIKDDPKEDPRENISHRFFVVIPKSIVSKGFSSGNINIDTVSRGGEPDEVMGIKLIAPSEVGYQKWAFNHDQMLQDFCEYIEDNEK